MSQIHNWSFTGINIPLPDINNQSVVKNFPDHGSLLNRNIKHVI